LGRLSLVNKRRLRWQHRERTPQTCAGGRRECPICMAPPLAKPSSSGASAFPSRWKATEACRDSKNRLLGKEKKEKSLPILSFLFFPFLGGKRRLDGCDFEERKGPTNEEEEERERFPLPAVLPGGGKRRRAGDRGQRGR
jgi:hypothetical protein